MSDRQALSKSSPSRGFNLGLHPPLAWMAILGLVLFSALCMAGAAKILNFAFPAVSFAVGAFLYFRYPILYVSFTWWIWFLTPLVRRLVDYRSGYTDPSPVLLSPTLVTLVTLATLWQHLPKTHRQGGLPFVLTFAGVFYGYLIGIIQNSPIVSTKALLDWLTPVLFGFHLFVNWRNYPSYSQTIQRTFAWGVLVMGVYGVYQYLVAPEWDRFWLTNLDFRGITFGRPNPLEIRVWSTMNGPLVFAVFMMAGLLLLFTNQGVLRLPASVAGYLAFLLSLVRTAWGGWFVAMLTLAVSLKAKLQMRLIITILVMVMCVFPLTTIEPFSEVINSRLQSFSNVDEDGSSQARKATYQRYLEEALTTFVGKGIGGMPGLDSSLLDMLFALGWFGTIFYMGGMLLLLCELLQGSKSPLDPFANSARAITIGVFFQLFLGPMTVGPSGIILWGFLGISVAARKYHSHQLTADLKKN